MQGVKRLISSPASGFPFPQSEPWLWGLDLAVLTVKNTSINREQNTKIILKKNQKIEKLCKLLQLDDILIF